MKRPSPSQAVGAIAARWGVSEGQVYTAVIGTVVALAAAIGGIPPTLADRVLAPSAGSARRTAQAQAPASSETTPSTVAGPVEAFSPPLVFPGAGVVAREPDETSVPPEPKAPAAADRLPPGGYRVFAAVPSPGAPQGAAVAPDGRVLVATNNGDGRGADGHPALFVFAAGGGAPKKIEVNSVASGRGLHDLVLPPGGNGDVAYGLASNPAGVLKVDVANSKVSTFALMPDIPACATTIGRESCETSPVDHAPTPVAAAFDGSGNLIVADAAQAVLWRVKPDRSVSLFFKAPEFVALDGLSGIARKNNVLFVTVAQSLTAAGKGVVYRLENSTLTQVAQTPSASLPRGLTVGRSGRLYVTLSGPGQILVLNGDGATVATLPRDPALSFHTPVRVAFSPTGLLVVEQAPSRPETGRVIELGVDDQG